MEFSDKYKTRFISTFSLACTNKILKNESGCMSGWSNGTKPKYCADMAKLAIKQRGAVLVFVTMVKSRMNNLYKLEHSSFVWMAKSLLFEFT